MVNYIHVFKLLTSGTKPRSGKIIIVAHSVSKSLATFFKITFEYELITKQMISSRNQNCNVILKKRLHILRRKSFGNGLS